MMDRETIFDLIRQGVAKRYGAPLINQHGTSFGNTTLSYQLGGQTMTILVMSPNVDQATSVHRKVEFDIEQFELDEVVSSVNQCISESRNRAAEFSR